VFGIRLNEIRALRRLYLLTGVALLLLSYPPFSFYFLAWFAPLFLFLCLELTPLRKAFRYGYFFGFLFYFFSLYWVSYVTGAGWIFAAFFQALYVAIFALGARFLMEPVLKRSNFRFRIFFIIGTASLWTFLEWVRVMLPGFGFGWNLLSYSQSHFLAFLQITEIIGSYGLSFLLMVGAGLLFLTIHDFRKKVSHRFFYVAFYLSLFLALVLSNFGFGIQKLKEPLENRPLRVGIVQGNIPQQLKWDPEVKAKIVEKYLKLSELLLYDRPDMVVWPEAAYPGFLMREIEGSPVAGLIRRSKTPFLIGSPRYENDKLYNAAIYFNPEGEPKTVYYKRSLVPFGEYIPFKNLLFFLKKIAYSFGVGDFVSGKLWTVFEAPMDFKFSTLVCFENIFPSLTRRFTKLGAEFFVVVTNDAWFHKSRAPYEHFNTSIFRAVETRRPFVHVANTGISGIIDAQGRTQGVLKDSQGEELFVSGGHTEAIFPQDKITFYVKYGEWLPFVMLVMILLAFLGVFVNRRCEHS